MKTLNYLRCALALILSFCSIGSWAEEIFKEDFTNTYQNVNMMSTSYSTTYGDWELLECKNDFKLGNNVLSITGFAQTPSINGLSGSATLNISCITPSKDSYPQILTITLINGGTFDDNSTEKSITIANGNNFTCYALNIINGSSNTIIKFAPKTGHCTLLNYVSITTIPTISLSQENDNSAVLCDENLDLTCDVITDRKLLAGVCHTMCLPFDMNRAKMIAAVGDDQNPLMYTYTGLDESNNMSFTEIGDNGTVPAGTPFLLKVDKDFENLKFYAVKITATTPTDVTYGGGVTFKGTFNPTDLQTDGTDLFLGTDNYLYIPASEARTLGGMRAYIHRSNTARLGISFNDEAAAIHETTVSAADSPIYNLQGQRIVQPRSKSLYIKNGKKMIQQ